MIEWLASLPTWLPPLVILAETIALLCWLNLNEHRVVTWMKRLAASLTYPNEEIACVAIKYPDIGVLSLPAPARHHHVMWTRLFIDGRATGGDAEQGFLTTSGRFVGRAEGLRIATARDQIEHKHGNPRELYSEDMWPTPAKAWGYSIIHVGDRPEAA